MSTAHVAAPSLHDQAPHQPSPAELVLQQSIGYMSSMCLYTAAKLGIADLLASGPKPVSVLASLGQCHEDRLYRVLRALASTGIFKEVAPRQFALTPLSESMRSDAPESTLPLILWMADPLHFRNYAELPHTVKTGEITFDHIYGKPVFDYLPTDKEEAESFHNAMTTLSNMVIPAVLDAYDFSGIGTLLDVAGGHGGVLCAILKRYPHMRGMLFDLESVVEGARKNIAQHGLTDRCSVVSGDFFKAVPEGADAIVMKHIIHDWDDEQALLILKNCRKALAGKKNARILLVESVIPADNQPHLGKFIDIEMMVFPGGRERSEEEFRQLFSKAGLRLNRVVPTKAPLWVVEAVIS
jgi:hypothetical protein